MSAEEEDCPPVSNATCTARMDDLKHQIESLKSTIKTTGALITLFLTVFLAGLEIYFRLTGK